MINSTLDPSIASRLSQQLKMIQALLHDSVSMVHGSVEDELSSHLYKAAQVLNKIVANDENKLT